MAYTTIGEPETGAVPQYSYNQELAQLPDPIYYNQPVTQGPQQTKQVWVPFRSYSSPGGWKTVPVDPAISGGEGLTSEEKKVKLSPQYSSDYYDAYSGGPALDLSFENMMRLYGVDEMQAQDAYQRNLLSENLGQFQEYTGEQLGGLFGAVNEIGASPYVSGNPLANAPIYNPYSGTRENFQTQQGYADAQIDHMNNYLGQIGSYFRNIGNPQTPSSQSILANAPSQGTPPPMPSVGMNFNVGGIGSAPNPFQSFGVGSGGWGNSQIGTGGWGTPLGGGGWNASAPAVAGWGTTTPTSLFGAGANARIP